MSKGQLKVLQVTRQYSPAIGGIEQAVSALSKALVELGHHVEVVTLNRSWGERKVTLPDQEVIDGIQVKRIGYAGNQRYALAPAVLRGIDDFDVVHIHSSDFFLDFLTLTRFIHQKPLVLTSHGFYFHTTFARSAKQFYYETFTRAALRQTGAVICVSRQDFNLATKIVPEYKLHLIPNGINLKFPENVSRDPLKILTVGRLASNKQLYRLLEAFTLVVKEESDARLDIIGKDYGERKKLEEEVIRLGIGQKAQFLGEVDNLILANSLVNSGIWVSASRYEGFGIGLLEAMAAGCVPVVSNITAFTELVENGKNGFIADFNDPKVAAEVMIEAINLPEQQRALIARENKDRTKHFCWDEIAKNVEKVYLDVINN